MERNSGESQSSAAVSSKFDNWTAVLDLQPIIQPELLRVGGAYHLNERCGGVTLRKAAPQGINPRILLLELVEGPGNGGDWVHVEGSFAATDNEFDSVSVRDMDGETTSIEIQVVR